MPLSHLRGKRVAGACSCFSFSFSVGLDWTQLQLARLCQFIRSIKKGKVTLCHFIGWIS